MAKPKNSESQAKAATRNAKTGRCGRCGSSRAIHWRDAEEGNLDCDKLLCTGKYKI